MQGQLKFPKSIAKELGVKSVKGSYFIPGIGQSDLTLQWQ